MSMVLNVVTTTVLCLLGVEVETNEDVQVGRGATAVIVIVAITMIAIVFGPGVGNAIAQPRGLTPSVQPSAEGLQYLEEHGVINYRQDSQTCEFKSVSISGSYVGEERITAQLLHSLDSGKTWRQAPFEGVEGRVNAGELIVGQNPVFLDRIPSDTPPGTIVERRFEIRFTTDMPGIYSAYIGQAEQDPSDNPMLSWGVQLGTFASTPCDNVPATGNYSHI